MSPTSITLIFLQFSCFAFFVWDGGVFDLQSNITLILQILGTLIGVWGILAMKLKNLKIAPEVKSNAQLMTGGPYRWIRNPMYTGVFMIFGAAVWSDFDFLRLGVFMILVIVLGYKILLEEKFLLERFGKNYKTYKSKTKRLIPFVI